MSRHDPADDTRSMFNTDSQVMSKKERKKKIFFVRSFFPSARGEGKGRGTSGKDYYSYGMKMKTNLIPIYSFVLCKDEIHTEKQSKYIVVKDRIEIKLG